MGPHENATVAELRLRKKTMDKLYQNRINEVAAQERAAKKCSTEGTAGSTSDDRTACLASTSDARRYMGVTSTSFNKVFGRVGGSICWSSGSKHWLQQAETSKRLRRCIGTWCIGHYVRTWLADKAAQESCGDHIKPCWRKGDDIL